jgi:ATP-dependent DNA ligase
VTPGTCVAIVAVLTKDKDLLQQNFMLQSMPVWEITGAEFTQHDVHTAAGISIRFPRVTKIRDDKTWNTATSLPELKVGRSIT